MFPLAKIRAAESIYETKGGLLHGPGGEAYYAAIWANDQAEYVNPFFPYLGYQTGNQSALCSFMHFARFINPEYKKLPSSIIAEGTDVWGGAGDRGDAAMVAYGAARYALARLRRAGRTFPGRKSKPMHFVLILRRTLIRLLSGKGDRYKPYPTDTIQETGGGTKKEYRPLLWRRGGRIQHLPIL